MAEKENLLINILLKEVKEFNSYYEPFLGSGALFFDLEPEKGVINDLNENLINFYKFVRDKPIELRREIIDLLENNIDKDSYIKIRKGSYVFF